VRRGIIDEKIILFLVVAFFVFHLEKLLAIFSIVSHGELRHPHIKRFGGGRPT